MRASIFAFALAALPLSGCASMSTADNLPKCIASHAETKWVWMSTSNGGSFAAGLGAQAGGGFRQVTDTVCDKREELPVAQPIAARKGVA